MDSIELISKFGWIKRAKRILKKSYKTWGNRVSVVWNDKPFQCSIEDLEFAIKQYEDKFDA